MRSLVLGLALTLAASSAYSATTVQLDASREKAIAWLVKNQKGDGSWRSASGLDVSTTAAVLDALAANGQTRLPAFALGVAWLQNAEAGSVDALARQIIALQSAGATYTAQRLAQRLLQERNSTDLLWGAYRYYAGSFPDSPLALQALKATSVSLADLESVVAAVAAANIAVTGVAGQSGWGHASGAAARGDGVGGQLWIVPTTYTIVALQQYQREPALVTAALTWLKSRQQTDGSFLDSDNAKSVLTAALAYGALAATSPQGPADAAAAKTLDYLVSPGVQSTDGSFGQEAFQTALALKAIATSTVLVDTDRDGVTDNVERLLGTDPNLADSKYLAGGNGSPSVSVLNLQALRGKLASLALPYGDISVCCTLVAGVLPDGLIFSGTRITGTPSRAGTFDFDFFYRTTAGLDRRVVASIEVATEIFRVAPDPFPLAVLFSDANVNKLKGGWQALADDFNGDGRLDLMTWFSGADEFFRPLECTTCPGYAGPAWGQLIGFQNVNGTLSLVSTITPNPRYAGDLRSIHAFDYNNDGRKDLLLVLHRVQTTSTNPADQPAVAYKNMVLLRNDAAPGGLIVFSDVTAAVGLNWTGEGEAAIVDANRDGAADIVLSDGANAGRLYVYNRTTNIYENKSAAASLGTLTKPVALDWDNDGVIDLISLDAVAGLRFLKSNGNTTFTSTTGDLPLTQLAGRGFSRLRAADVTGDGRIDLVAFETTTVPAGAGHAYAGARAWLLENRGVSAATGKPIFADVTPAALSTASGNAGEVSYGGDVADYDSDTRPDIFLSAREPATTIVATTIVKQNQDGSFVRLGAETGFPRGVASFDSPIPIDLDDDAAVDLLLPNSGNTAYQLLNNGTAYHAVIIVLRGKTGKDGLGARVQVTAGGITQTQQVLADHARGGRLRFGIGTAESAQVRVNWPDGTVQDLDVPDVDRIVTVVQP